MSTRTYQAPETSPPGGAARARWLALAVLCIPLLMVNLDNLVLNVALPTLVRDLRASTTELQWIVDAYVIVFAGLLLVAGSVADRIGRKRVFIAGLAAFAAGSTWAAFSGSAGMLIAARASMGIGGAMMMPSTLAILTSLFSEPRYPVGHRVGSGLACPPTTSASDPPPTARSFRWAVRSGWRSAAGFEFPDFQHEFRRDDGAGPAVIARLRALQPGDESLSHVTLALSDGEPGRMIDLWEGARLAVVIDAVRACPQGLRSLPWSAATSASAPS